MMDRKSKSRQIRIDAAELAFNRTHETSTSNGDEQLYKDQNYFANFSKGLPHHDNGEVKAENYEQLLAAITSGNSSDYNLITLGLGRKLTNPQAGWAFDLEGADANSLAIPPAPVFASAEVAAEMVELYWMALARDVCFNDYDKEDIIEKAVKDLNKMSDYRGEGPASGKVSHKNIFRGFTPGDLAGPYLSQFLLLDIPYGTLCISQKQKTAKEGINFLIDFDEWLAVQRGKDASLKYSPCEPHEDEKYYEKDQLYIRNLRDLATYVHYDALYEAYLNACLILLGMGAPVDEGNPYKHSTNQLGFGTFGGPHILSLVTEVATRALKAVWHQKWNIHRRLRPEAFGGRVHQYLKNGLGYPIHQDLLLSEALKETYKTSKEHESYLLPQAFAEGSPTHPAYGAGHATVAGACVTILKAWFDESHKLPKTLVASPNGKHCKEVKGGDHLLTVGGELNKLAANIAIGRNAGGVHYWTDYTASVVLGEKIAMSILEEQKATYHEKASFTFTKFDGTTCVI